MNKELPLLFIKKHKFKIIIISSAAVTLFVAGFIFSSLYNPEKFILKWKLYEKTPENGQYAIASYNSRYYYPLMHETSTSNTIAMSESHKDPKTFDEEKCIWNFEKSDNGYYIYCLTSIDKKLYLAKEGNNLVYGNSLSIWTIEKENDVSHLINNGYYLGFGLDDERFKFSSEMTNPQKTNYNFMLYEYLK